MAILPVGLSYGAAIKPQFKLVWELLHRRTLVLPYPSAEGAMKFNETSTSEVFGTSG